METQNQESEEGIWILDDTGKHLKFIPQQVLDASLKASEATEIHRTHPTTEEVTSYLSSLSFRQKNICSKLREQGWNDPAVHNFLTLLEGQRKRICAELRSLKGQSEDEIQRLNEICDHDDITDFSHLQRPGASPADDDFQVQLFLLEEWKRQRRIMVGQD